MENFSYIDDYFQGLLEADEKSLFEQRLLEDKSFADEVAFYLNVERLAREKQDADTKERFRTLYQQSKEKPAVVRSLNRTWLAVAAAVFTVALVGVLYFMARPAGPQLADRYINERLTSLGVTMGTKEDSLQTGLGLYNKGNFSEASQLFENIVRRDTGNYLAQEYAGLSFLRRGEYARALDYFKQLERATALRANPAKFYQALTLLKRNGAGDETEAKRLLQEVVAQNLEGKTTAESWLKELQ